MARHSLSAIRRSELAHAAYTALSVHGLKGTTLESVAKIAGVSKASVLHYFKNKDELLEAALRQSSNQLRQEAITLFKLSESPWERVFAVIEANLSPASYNPQVANGWVALCSEGAHSARYQRIQNAIYQRTRTNILLAMRVITTPEQAQIVTRLIITLIDGLWIRCSLDSDGFDRDAARQQFRFVLGSLFPMDQDLVPAQKKMINISASLFA